MNIRRRRIDRVLVDDAKVLCSNVGYQVIAIEVDVGEQMLTDTKSSSDGGAKYAAKALAHVLTPPKPQAWMRGASGEKRLRSDFY